MDSPIEVIAYHDDRIKKAVRSNFVDVRNELPGSVRLLMVGDVHVSDRSPSTRTSSYREDILAKLVEIGHIASTHRVDAAVFVGDIFHSKIPHKTSHKTVQGVSRILDDFPVPVFILPGNHDYAGKHHESLSSHPLGTVAMMRNVTIFGTVENRSVVLPAANSSVRIVGVREEESVSAFEFSYVDDIPVVVVAHSAIFPPGKAPEVWETLDINDIVAVYESAAAPAITWYGHIHEPHGHYNVGGHEFANFGAISRGSLHEEGALDRVPAVGLLTVSASGVRVEEIPLQSARPASEVFRITEVREERTIEAERNAFVEALSEAEVKVFSVETAKQSILEHVDVDTSVRYRAIEFIDEVS